MQIDGFIELPLIRHYIASCDREALTRKIIVVEKNLMSLLLAIKKVAFLNNTSREYIWVITKK